MSFASRLKAFVPAQGDFIDHDFIHGIFEQCDSRFVHSNVELTNERFGYFLEHGYLKEIKRNGRKQKVFFLKAYVYERIFLHG